MTHEQTIQKIKNLEKSLLNEGVPEASKEKMRQMVETLKKEVAQLEDKGEKEVKKEEVEQSKLAARIENLKKTVASDRVPEASKVKMREAIKKAEEELEQQKKEIKEDKKEAEQEKKEIKEAVKKVEKIAKSKTPSKQPKVKVPQVKEEQREKKQDSRKVKLKKIMTELEQLIEKNKKLSKYKGSGVDLEKDAKRSAKPFGYRFTGKHDYRIPTEQQVKRGLKTGKVYYEGRPERADKFPTGKGTKGVKLERGGSLGSTKLVKYSVVYDINADRPDLYKGKEGTDFFDKTLNKNINSLEDLQKIQSMLVEDGGKWDYHPHENGAEITYRKKQSNGMYDNLHFIVETEQKDEDGEVLEVYGIDWLEDEIEDAMGGMMAKGGSLDADRFAKPMGWRWKDSAVEDGIINRASLSHSPSLKMRKQYPDYVYSESRPTKSDKNPSRKYQSLAKGGGISKRGKTVTLKSGAKGNRNLLHNRYDDFEDFESYCEMYGVHKTLGYKTPKQAWDANPIVESGTNPSDFRKVSKYAKGGSLDADRFAKPMGWRWKDSAVEDGIINRASLSHSPSLKMRKQYPDYVYSESRPTKSDKNPSRKYQSLAKGGSLDADRFAKPSGWRWKNSAVEDGIISRASLSHSPSLKMRREYPDYVAFESRTDKSDKKPSRKYQSI
jgi:hypothetical protein